MKLFLILLPLLLVTSCQTIKSVWHINETSMNEKNINKKIVWEQNKEQLKDIAGYKIYLGIKDKNYRLIKEIHDPQKTSVVFSELKEVLKYNTANHFYVTAFDHNKNESLPSNKTCWGIGCNH